MPCLPKSTCVGQKGSKILMAGTPRCLEEPAHLFVGHGGAARGTHCLLCLHCWEEGGRGRRGTRLDKMNLCQQM